MLEVKIEKVIFGGDGLARTTGGFILFVPFTAEGEHVRIRITERKAHHARAEVVEEFGDAELGELNLVAPPLGWRLLDDSAREDAQRRFALCVESALDRLGLGPLSHRGP